MSDFSEESNEFEDYMSNKFLNMGEDVKPGLLFKISQKRQFKIHKKQLNLKNVKTNSEQEARFRDRGLNSVIPSSNVGFRLLQKMGFVEGQGLGKTQEGIKKPIDIKFKNNREGIGIETFRSAKLARKQEMKHKNFEETERQFKQNNKEKHNARRLYNDVFKAQKICEELDLKLGVKIPKLEFYWRKQDNLETSEENEDKIDENMLHNLITYLRETHSYCIYCGDFIAKYVSKIQCPGYFRDDHDY